MYYIYYLYTSKLYIIINITDTESTGLTTIVKLKRRHK